MSVPPAGEALPDVHGVVAGHLDPAVLALKQATAAGEVDAVRAYALEIAVLGAEIFAACPPAGRRPSGAATARTTTALCLSRGEGRAARRGGSRSR